MFPFFPTFFARRLSSHSDISVYLLLLKVGASLLQLLLPSGVMVEVIMVNIVSAGHIFVQQHTHPTYHALRSLDQQMFLCYSQPGTPALPSPVEGAHAVYCS